VSAVGIIVNPWAGKDVRRLHAATGHTPDAAKIGIVRRIAVAAIDAGADRVYAAGDSGRLAERAIAGIEGAELVTGPGTGSMLDTRRAAAQLVELGCMPLVVLGGDGTCRDVAIGAGEATLIAVSTGTNNVFPLFVDATSAGAAAGLVASGQIDAGRAGRRAKLLEVAISTGEHDVALVDVALIDAAATGARAVVRAGSVRAVVAAIATPASTGLSSVAGRLCPLSRDGDGAVAVRLGGEHRLLRVPIVPGALGTVAVESVELLAEGAAFEMAGPGVLAYDGERDRVLPAGATATVTVSRRGPLVLDVERVLQCAAAHRLFDLPVRREELSDGD
jgi:hypothetical protein